MRPERYSYLKNMAVSPLFYKTRLAAELKETPSMRLGSGTDGYVLGRPPVVYDGVRRGAAWEAFKASHSDAIILSESEDKVARRMADSLSSHKGATRLLTGVHFAEIHWSFCGRAMVSHPDNVGDGFVTDLKTTRSADPRRFPRAAVQYAYHAQLALYGEAVASMGNPARELWIVAVESSEPHDVVCYPITERARDAGLKLCRSWMEQLIVCEATDIWPGYTDAPVPIDVPDEFELTFGEEQEAA